MNQPDRQDLFVVPEGQQKITYKDDPKVPNARQYKNPFPCVEGMLPSCLALVGEGNVLREDHTLGNPIRMCLLRDPNVKFAAYQTPHPLCNDLLFRVQTNGKVTPDVALRNSIDTLKEEVRTLGEAFENAVEKFQKPY